MSTKRAIIQIFELASVHYSLPIIVLFYVYVPALVVFNKC